MRDTGEIIDSSSIDSHNVEESFEIDSLRVGDLLLVDSDDVAVLDRILRGGDRFGNVD